MRTIKENLRHLKNKKNDLERGMNRIIKYEEDGIKAGRVKNMRRTLQDVEKDIKAYEDALGGVKPMYNMTEGEKAVVVDKHLPEYAGCHVVKLKGGSVASVTTGDVWGEDNALLVESIDMEAHPACNTYHEDGGSLTWF